jgi:hypothetical protein
VTALVESGTGLLLLVAPRVPLSLLLGLVTAAPEAEFISRIASAALTAIGVACWQARGDQNGSALRGLLTGLLIYNVTAAALLTYAGTVLDMVGIVLWPGVALHTVLAGWCAACFKGVTCGGSS